MGFLPMEADLLPPYDDRVFKLILTAPEAGPLLTDLISAILGRPMTNAVVRNNELPPEDAEEKAERFDVNRSDVRFSHCRRSRQTRRSD